LLNDQANSDTLVVKADSSYKWTRTVDSERTLMLDAEHAARSFNLVGSLQITNLQVETKHTWKQLTDTTISWMGNRDYKLKLDGDKLTMVSKVYLAFTRTSK